MIEKDAKTYLEEKSLAQESEKILDELTELEDEIHDSVEKGEVKEVLEEEKVTTEELKESSIEVKEMYEAVEANNIESYKKLLLDQWRQATMAEAQMSAVLVKLNASTPESKKDIQQYVQYSSMQTQYRQAKKVSYKRAQLIDGFLFNLKPFLDFKQYGKFKLDKLLNAKKSVYNKMDKSEMAFVDPELMDVAVKEIFREEGQYNPILMKLYMYLDRLAISDPVDGFYIFLVEIIIKDINNPNFKRRDEVIQALSELLKI